MACTMMICTGTSSEPSPLSPVPENPSPVEIEIPNDNNDSSDDVVSLDSLDSGASESSTLAMLKSQIRRLDSILDNLDAPSSSEDEDDGIQEELFNLTFQERMLQQELEAIDVVVTHTLSWTVENDSFDMLWNEKIEMNQNQGGDDQTQATEKTMETSELQSTQLATKKVYEPCELCSDFCGGVNNNQTQQETRDESRQTLETLPADTEVREAMKERAASRRPNVAMHLDYTDIDISEKRLEQSTPLASNRRSPLFQLDHLISGEGDTETTERVRTGSTPIDILLSPDAEDCFGYDALSPMSARSPTRSTTSRFSTENAISLSEKDDPNFKFAFCWARSPILSNETFDFTDGDDEDTLTTISRNGPGFRFLDEVDSDVHGKNDCGITSEPHEGNVTPINETISTGNADRASNTETAGLSLMRFSSSEEEEILPQAAGTSTGSKVDNGVLVLDETDTGEMIFNIFACVDGSATYEQICAPPETREPDQENEFTINFLYLQASSGPETDSSDMLGRITTQLSPIIENDAEAGRSEETDCDAETASNHDIHSETEVAKNYIATSNLDHENCHESAEIEKDSARETLELLQNDEGERACESESSSDLGSRDESIYTSGNSDVEADGTGPRHESESSDIEQRIAGDFDESPFMLLMRKAALSEIKEHSSLEEADLVNANSTASATQNEDSPEMPTPSENCSEDISPKSPKQKLENPSSDSLPQMVSPLDYELEAADGLSMISQSTHQESTVLSLGSAAKQLLSHESSQRRSEALKVLQYELQFNLSLLGSSSNLGTFDFDALGSQMSSSYDKEAFISESSWNQVASNREHMITQINEGKIDSPSQKLRDDVFDKNREVQNETLQEQCGGHNSRDFSTDLLNASEVHIAGREDQCLPSSKTSVVQDKSEHNAPGDDIELAALNECPNSNSNKATAPQSLCPHTQMKREMVSPTSDAGPKPDELKAVGQITKKEIPEHKLGKDPDVGRQIQENHQANMHKQESDDQLSTLSKPVVQDKSNLEAQENEHELMKLSECPSPKLTNNTASPRSRHPTSKEKVKVVAPTNDARPKLDESNNRGPLDKLDDHRLVSEKGVQIQENQKANMHKQEFVDRASPVSKVVVQGESDFNAPRNENDLTTLSEYRSPKFAKINNNMTGSQLRRRQTDRMKGLILSFLVFLQNSQSQRRC